MKKAIGILSLISTPYLYTMHAQNYTNNNLMQDPNHHARMKVNIEVVSTSHNEITFTITQAFLNTTNIFELKNILKRLSAQKILLLARDNIEAQIENTPNVQLQNRRDTIVGLIVQSNNANLTTQELNNLSDQASDHENFYYYTFEHQ